MIGVAGGGISMTSSESMHPEPLSENNRFFLFGAKENQREQRERERVREFCCFENLDREIEYLEFRGVFVCNGGGSIGPAVLNSSRFDLGGMRKGHQIKL